MARALRIEYLGALYHVTSRGNERKSIFRSDEDRQRFVIRLEKSVQRYGIKLHAYVLMSNHFHLLAGTPRGNLNRFMAHLLTSYTIDFNRRYQRSGHLFSGRYKAKLVEETRYLMALTRYLHLNPIRVRSCRQLSLEERVKVLREYRWSSYGGYAGMGKPEDFVDYQWLSEVVEGYRPGDGRRAYCEYVESGIAQQDQELERVLQISSKAIGEERFCQWVEEQHRQRVKDYRYPGGISKRVVEVGVSVESILQEVAAEFQVPLEELRRFRSRAVGRLMAMHLLQQLGGLTLQAIARELGIKDGSRISKGVRNLEGWLEKDGKLRRRRNQILHRLATFNTEIKP
jgi:putative transposase